MSPRDENSAAIIPFKLEKLVWHGVVDDRLAALEKILVVLFLTLLILLSLYNIVARVLWGGSSQTVSEMIPMLVLWLALIGGSLGVRREQHISFKLLRASHFFRLRTISRRIIGLYGFTVLGVIGVSAVAFAINEISHYGWRGSSAVAYPYFCLAAGFRFGRWLLAPDPLPDHSQGSSP